MSADRSTDSGRISDLTVLFVLIVVTPIVLLLPGIPRSIEWAFGIPFLLVVPGYALTAALFAGDPRGLRSGSEDGETPGWAAKVAIALVSSALVVAVVGSVLGAIGSLRLAPTVLAIAGISGVFAFIAMILRRRLRSSTRLARGTTSGRSGRPQKSATSALSGLQVASLAIAIIVLLAALTFAGTTTTVQSSYSEATLLASADDDELLGDTETTFVAGEENALAVALANHEGTPVEYELVGTLQRVDADGNVLEEERVDSGRVRLAHNESVVVERAIEPTLTGEDLRLQYLVYKGAAPSNPTAENADLSLRVWIDVTGGSS